MINGYLSWKLDKDYKTHIKIMVQNIKEKGLQLCNKITKKDNNIELLFEAPRALIMNNNDLDIIRIKACLYDAKIYFESYNIKYNCYIKSIKHYVPHYSKPIKYVLSKEFEDIFGKGMLMVPAE